MTTTEREELLTLVEALSEAKRRALFASLRQGLAVPMKRPLSALGPIPDDQAEQILHAILEDRERLDSSDW